MITLTTILYEGNFIDFLKEETWFFTFKSKYITKKQLIINNLVSTDLFNKIIDKLKNKHEFDVIFVSEHEIEAIDNFKLDMDQNSVGYWYSIPYFVGILKTKTPYMFNVSSDCTNSINVDDSFFEKSINVLGSNTKHIVTTLPWGEHWGELTPTGVPSHISCVGEWEQVNTPSYNDSLSVDDFWCTDVFSDQVFIGNINKLKNVDYNCPKMGRYNGPIYGGTNAFEARLSEFLANNNLFRLIFKNKELYYKHMG